MSARPVQVFAAACLTLLLAAGASAQDLPPFVNRFATVRSADGYLNLRADQGTGSAIEARIPNGVQVLVGYCAAGRAGRRWCRVQRGADTQSPSGQTGYTYDAELSTF